MGTANVYSTYDPTSLFAGAFPVRQRPVALNANLNPAPVATSPGGLVATPLPRGTLLGRVTATDTYIPCVKTATDGSQVPAAILAADTETSAGAVTAPGYFEGEFAGEVMTIDPSWTIATVQAALRQAGSSLYVRSVGTLG